MSGLRIEEVTSLPSMKTRPSSSNPTGFSSRERGELAGEVERDAAAARQPRQRAVHRPGVEVAEAEPLGEKPCDRALAGPCGPVDGDDHQVVVALSESSRS